MEKNLFSFENFRSDGFHSWVMLRRDFDRREIYGHRFVDTDLLDYPATIRDAEENPDRLMVCLNSRDPFFPELAAAAHTIVWGFCLNPCLSGPWSTDVIIDRTAIKRIRRQCLLLIHLSPLFLYTLAIYYTLAYSMNLLCDCSSYCDVQHPII